MFETAYHTNENLLICAPTGAGKTNVAMLTILHCVEAHIENGVIQRDKFKIVYVAPMKALAAEMTAGFGKRCVAWAWRVSAIQTPNFVLLTPPSQSLGSSHSG